MTRSIVALAALTTLMVAAPFASAQDDQPVLPAAEQTREAHELLGLHDEGWVTEDPERIERGLELLREAAEAGNPEAQNSLGTLYNLGAFGVERDTDEAARWFAMAMQSDSADVNIIASVNWSGLMIERGENLDSAFAMLEIVYDSGEFGAELASTALAYAYAYGRGTERDLERAGALFQEALRWHPDNSEIHWMLGRGFASGWYVESVDLDRAIEHFRTAAELGHARAAWEVGMAHLRGDGELEPDSSAAYSWYVRAADGGSIDGMISTAVMLATGDGVALDGEAAAHWYERAARLGSAHAMRGLGAIHVNAEVEAPDRPFGLALLELAAAGGDEIAMHAIQQFADERARERMAIDAAQAEWLLTQELSE